MFTAHRPLIFRSDALFPARSAHRPDRAWLQSSAIEASETGIHCFPRRDSLSPQATEIFFSSSLTSLTKRSSKRGSNSTKSRFFTQLTTSLATVYPPAGTKGSFRPSSPNSPAFIPSECSSGCLRNCTASLLGKTSFSVPTIEPRPHFSFSMRPEVRSLSIGSAKIRQAPSGSAGDTRRRRASGQDLRPWTRPCPRRWARAPHPDAGRFRSGEPIRARVPRRSNP